MKRGFALSRTDKQINTRVYNQYQRLRMEDGWYGTDKIQNYKQLLHIIDLTDVGLDHRSCLDIGCGTGDLSSFVRKLGANDYLGIDIYEPAIKKARQKYPGEKFIWADFLKVNLHRTFDFSFCSGSLSVKIADNYAFLEAVVRRMWKLSGTGLAFNILTDDDKLPDEDLFFYNLDSVEKICRKITRTGKIIIEKNKKRAEAHIYMYRV